MQSLTALVFDVSRSRRLGEQGGRRSSASHRQLQPGSGHRGQIQHGSLTPLMVAMVDALVQLGGTDDESRAALAALLPAPIKNAAGIEVGEMHSVLHLQVT